MSGFGGVEVRLNGVNAARQSNSVCFDITSAGFESVDVAFGGCNATREGSRRSFSSIDLGLLCDSVSFDGRELGVEGCTSSVFKGGQATVLISVLRRVCVDQGLLCSSIRLQFSDVGGHAGIEGIDVRLSGGCIRLSDSSSVSSGLRSSVESFDSSNDGFLASEVVAVSQFQRTVSVQADGNLRSVEFRLDRSGATVNSGYSVGQVRVGSGASGSFSGQSSSELVVCILQRRSRGQNALCGSSVGAVSVQTSRSFDAINFALKQGEVCARSSDGSVELCERDGIVSSNSVRDCEANECGIVSRLGSEGSCGLDELCAALTELNVRAKANNTKILDISHF